jgi:hypothetical protein
VKNKCGPGQPPKPHRSWISRLAFPPLGAARRRYWSDSTHTCVERHFYQHWLQNMIRRTIALQPLRRPAAQLTQRASCRGGRNARATGTRSRALPIFPRQFTLENCQSATGSANIHHSASRENYHVFAEPTLKQNVATRNRKTFRSCEQTVDDETCLWKPEEKPARIAARELSVSIFSIT